MADILQTTFWNGFYCMLAKISLKACSQGPYETALIQAMAFRRIRAKQLSEPKQTYNSIGLNFTEIWMKKKLIHKNQSENVVC